MQHLDYCENLIKFLTTEVRKVTQTMKRKGKKDPDWTKLAKRNVRKWNKRIAFLKEATKFILPPNGKIIVDPQLSHIVGTRLELPYKKMVLEMPSSDKHDPTRAITKNAVFILTDHDDTIEVQCFLRGVGSQVWRMFFPISIRKDCDISIKDGILFVNPVVRHLEASDEEIAFLLNTCLNFLNSLAAPAVKVEKRCSQSTQKKHHSTSSDSRIQGDYHYIFMDIPKKIYENSATTSSSSITPPEERFRPAEHERQGHWRHFKDGTKTWINTQTINKGIGKKLEKKYIVRGPKQRNQPVA